MAILAIPCGRDFGGHLQLFSDEPKGPLKGLLFIVW